MSTTVSKLSLFFLFILLTFSSCQHEPLVTINGNNGGGNGNGNGNNSLPPCDPDSVYFEQDILPLFVSNCTMSGCHNSASHASGIDLSSYAAVMSSNVIKPGEASNSDLFEAITETDSNKIMPPPYMSSALPTAQINLIKKWINQGALNLKCDKGCDTTSVTYNGTIKPLLQNSCTRCHNASSAGGGYNLTNYADASGNKGVQSSALDTSLSRSVNHTGSFPMPKGGAKLPQCKLDQIRIWVAAGAPNN